MLYSLPETVDVRSVVFGYWLGGQALLVVCQCYLNLSWIDVCPALQPANGEPAFSLEQAAPLHPWSPVLDATVSPAVPLRLGTIKRLSLSLTRAHTAPLGPQTVPGTQKRERRRLFPLCFTSGC